MRPISLVLLLETILLAGCCCPSGEKAPKRRPSGRDATFIRRFPTSGSGVRVAVKDLIDVKDTVTSCGSQYVLQHPKPARRDADCLRGIRELNARIVGKTNLCEFAIGGTGWNSWFGTPRNPINPALIPGGSSSGSAVAVATNQADVALGTDTLGSIRIPAACCGVVGLMTTHGRISLRGVWPLSQELDTIGPIAKDVSGAVLGMKLLQPGFRVSSRKQFRVATFRPSQLNWSLFPQKSAMEEAIVQAVRQPGFVQCGDVTKELKGWKKANGDAIVIAMDGAHKNDGPLLAESKGKGIGKFAAGSICIGKGPLVRFALPSAQKGQAQWKRELDRVFKDKQIDFIALPTLLESPPNAPKSDREEGAAEWKMSKIITTPAVNLAGYPALVIPLPAKKGTVPPSLQLVGRKNSEADLLAAGLLLEKALHPKR